MKTLSGYLQATGKQILLMPLEKRHFWKPKERSIKRFIIQKFSAVLNIESELKEYSNLRS